MGSGSSKELSSSECDSRRNKKLKKESTESEEEMEGAVAPMPDEVDNLSKEVFGNHLIREKILNFAIHKANEKKILRETIGSLRLVQKSWLQTITKLFKKNGDPLYQLVLDGDDSLNESVQVQENGKILDQFVDSVTSFNSPIHRFIPTFSLNMRPSFFRLENRDSLFKCLRLCGSHLLEVKMEVPVNGGSLPGMLPGSLSLGRLKKLSVIFTATLLANMDNRELVVAQDSNGAKVIQPFLLGATALTEFQVLSNGTETPLGSQFLPLPTTLTKINMHCGLDTSQMEFLANSRLPHLRELILMVSNREYENNVLFRIFENFRFTLRYLHILGIRTNNPIQHTNMYRFPVMEKLDTFKTHSIHSELEANQLALEKCLPKLACLSLCNQTEVTFESWTENSKFSSVRTLKLCPVNRNFNQENRVYDCNLDLQLMQRLHVTFPNVTHLQLTATTATSTCALKFIFKEMRQLTVFGFDVQETSPEVGSEVFWDALLIGIVDNLQLASGIRAIPDMWPSIYIDNKRMPSIRMLTKLRCLKLFDKVTQPVVHDTSHLLISDMAFHFALMKMKRLTKLVFQGRFLASDKMTKKWRECGKIYVYYPPPPANV